MIRLTSSLRAVHDYFQILGVAPGAGARDIREACARHAARPHANLLESERGADGEGAAAGGHGALPGSLVDVAIDFPDISGIIDRMQVAFFRTPR